MYGRLDELDFLSRLYDLYSLPSTDSRFHNAYGDIFQHRVNNDDWENDWIFTDQRLQLGKGADETFLSFLSEMLHPVVRNPSDAVTMANEFNRLLQPDGWQIVAVNSISGRPVYGPMPFGSSDAMMMAAARSIQHRLDSPYIGSQITRLQQALEGDPELAIGQAKDFLESITKTVLKAKSVPWSRSDSFPGLVKKALNALAVVPAGIDNQGPTEQAIRGMINSLGATTDKMTEIRNWHGTGHGKDSDVIGLQAHHARLVIGASVTIAQFMFDCLTATDVVAPSVVEADAQPEIDYEDS